MRGYALAAVATVTATLLRPPNSDGFQVCPPTGGRAATARGAGHQREQGRQGRQPATSAFVGGPSQAVSGSSLTRSCPSRVRPTGSALMMGRKKGGLGDELSNKKKKSKKQRKREKLEKEGGRLGRKPEKLAPSERAAGSVPAPRSSSVMEASQAALGGEGSETEPQPATRLRSAGDEEAVLDGGKGAGESAESKFQKQQLELLKQREKEIRMEQQKQQQEQQLEQQWQQQQQQQQQQQLQQQQQQQQQQMGQQEQLARAQQQMMQQQQQGFAAEPQPLGGTGGGNKGAGSGGLGANVARVSKEEAQAKATRQVDSSELAPSMDGTGLMRFLKSENLAVDMATMKAVEMPRGAEQERVIDIFLPPAPRLRDGYNLGPKAPFMAFVEKVRELMPSDPSKTHSRGSPDRDFTELINFLKGNREYAGTQGRNLLQNYKLSVQESGDREPLLSAHNMVNAYLKAENSVTGPFMQVILDAEARVAPNMGSMEVDKYAGETTVDVSATWLVLKAVVAEWEKRWEDAKQDFPESSIVASANMTESVPKSVLPEGVDVPDSVKDAMETLQQTDGIVAEAKAVLQEAGLITEPDRRRLTIRNYLGNAFREGNTWSDLSLDRIKRITYAMQQMSYNFGQLPELNEKLVPEFRFLEAAFGLRTTTEVRKLAYKEFCPKENMEPKELRLRIASLLSNMDRLSRNSYMQIKLAIQDIFVCLVPNTDEEYMIFNDNEDAPELSYKTYIFDEEDEETREWRDNLDVALRSKMEMELYNYDFLFRVGGTKEDPELANRPRASVVGPWLNRLDDLRPPPDPTAMPIFADQNTAIFREEAKTAVSWLEKPENNYSDLTKDDEDAEVALNSANIWAYIEEQEAKIAAEGGFDLPRPKGWVPPEDDDDDTYEEGLGGGYSRRGGNAETKVIPAGAMEALNAEVALPSSWATEKS